MYVDLNELVVVALGSNLPGSFASSHELLEAALIAMESEGLKIRSRSRWWRSASWPDPTKPAYLNGIALVEPERDPLELLALLQSIEQQFGRKRGEIADPRTLDLDIIAHGKTRLVTQSLTLPHPRAHLRRFVMGPLAEIAPGWVHPALQLSAEELSWGTHVGNDARPEQSVPIEALTA